jgi:hypothetical protein
MNNDKFRRQIAFEAARLMYERQESEYFRAKLRAAKRICRGWVKPKDLPSNAEVRDQIQHFARLHEGDDRIRSLRDMRIEGLRMMRLLEAFRPRLIGSTLTGHVRRGSDIDIHLFSDTLEAVEATLESSGIVYTVERKQVRKHGEERVFTHIHIADRFEFELTLYAANLAHYVFKSSVTGKAIERASIAELEQLLASEYPDLDLENEVSEAEERIDRFQVYRALLLPLESVKQSREYHPEGDALYHSLQVFELARDTMWGRRSSPQITSPRDWRPSPNSSRRVLRGSSSTTWKGTLCTRGRSAPGLVAGSKNRPITMSSCCCLAAIAPAAFAALKFPRWKRRWNTSASWRGRMDETPCRKS